MREVDHRDALADAPRHKLRKALARRRAQWPVKHRFGQDAFQAQRMHQQGRGVIRGIVGTVAEVQLRADQPE